MRTLSLLSIIIIVASISTADIIVQKKYFTNDSVLSFEKFGSAQGTLISVEINFGLTITNGTLIIDNDSNNNISGVFEFGTTAAMDSSDVNPPTAVTINPVFYSQSFELAENLGDVTGDYDPTAPDGTQYTGTSAGKVVSGVVDSSNRHDYMGSDSYDITVAVSPWIDIGQFSKVEYYASSPVNNSGYIEVIYSYTSIPEPATFVLLVMAIAAKARLKRKKRK